MTTRHGLFVALSLIRRLYTIGTPLRSSHCSRQLGSTSTLESTEAAQKKDVVFTPIIQEDPELSNKVQSLMRSTPHPLTSILAYSKPGRKAPSALLVSSFNTVCLSPIPYVSFNIKIPSKTYQAIRASKGFNASGIHDARVAHLFTKVKPMNKGDFGWRSLVDTQGHLREGGAWWLSCDYVEEMCMKVGDHMIIVGAVKQAVEYEGKKKMGLIYADQKYRRPGAVEEHLSREEGEQNPPIQHNPPFEY